MGLGFRQTSLPPRGCSRLFPELSWWDCTPSFRRLESIFIWHTFSHSDLLWRWGRRGATSFNVSTHDPSRNTSRRRRLSFGACLAKTSTKRSREEPGHPTSNPSLRNRNLEANDSATMSAPLPPYSTFRTDNKVRPTAAGPAGGIGSGRRPEKGRVPRAVRPSVLRGVHGRYLGPEGGPSEAIPGLLGTADRRSTRSLIWVELPSIPFGRI